MAGAYVTLRMYIHAYLKLGKTNKKTNKINLVSTNLISSFNRSH